MLRLVLPQWFLGPDIMIDFFSFLILLIFSAISLKYYTLNKNKKFIYLGIAFVLIGLGELFNIIMNIGLYYDITIVSKVGRIVVTSHIVKSIKIIYYIGFFLYRLLVMLGFYLLYYTSKKKKSEFDFLMIIYFIVVSAIFSENVYYLFHTTVSLIVLAVFVNYSKLYIKTKSENTKILAVSFFVLLISHIMMVFSSINTSIYIGANFLQLAAYILLLMIIIRIYKHGKKKQT